jgi:RNA polymerase sigma factor (sigma-70 family)
MFCNKQAWVCITSVMGNTVTPTCPRCGARMPAAATGGVCPRCAAALLQATRTESLEAAQSRQRFTPPTPAELAAKFPELEILAFIGQGGMGAVYKARQKLLDREVALKILPPGIGAEPAFAERFAREAKALAKLNHPGIVTLYEFGQADGLFYFLMELVEGVTLRQVIQRGQMSSREALAIVPRICDALQYAHDQGIVHRDIKPENILLDRQGRVKVADFGLAKLVSAQPPARVPSQGAELVSSPVSLTEVKVMGTPQYMAPEQLEHPAQVDHRADIYALGVVLYQMLTGELPGSPLEPPSARVHGLQLDVRLDEVVLRALEREPERRYQQVSEVRTAVETIGQVPLPDAGKGELEQPFAALVRRHIDLVHSVAARCAATAQEAAEITQAVFLILEPRARRLPRRTVLSGWLYDTACLAAAQFQRAGGVRPSPGAASPDPARAKEPSSVGSLAANAAPGDGPAPQAVLDSWPKLSSQLDAAMRRLRRKERDALVLRYFENKSLRQVGLALGVAEHTAQQRAAGALHKLRRRLNRRGLELTAAELTQALSANATQMAPAGLADTICATAREGSAVAPSTLALVKGTLRLMTLLKLRVAAGFAAAFILAASAIAFASGAAAARHPVPEIQGDWEGDAASGPSVVEGQNRHNRLVLHITKVKGGYRATADQVDVGRKGAPIERITYTYPIVQVDYTPLLIWRGTVNTNASEMTFNEQGLHVVLKRTTSPTPVPPRLANSEFAPRDDCPLQGYWKGALDIKPEPLPLNWKIARQADGTFRVELDNPEQAALGQPGTGTYNPPKVELLLTTGEDMFRGTMNSNHTELTGTWLKPGDTSMPASFKRADYEADRAREAAKDYSPTSRTDVRGHWLTTAKVGDTALRMSLDIASLPDGTLCASSRSPDLSDGNPDPYPATRFQFTAPHVHAEWKWVQHAVLDCDLDDNKLIGTVRVHDTDFPVTFERVVLSRQSSEAAPAAGAAAQQDKAAAGSAEPRLAKPVTFATQQASVQDIVQNLVEQVGLKYDWNKSHAQTDPLCRNWVRNVAIDGKTCSQALEDILKPVGLRYQVEKGVVVLSRRPSGQEKAAAPSADPRLAKTVTFATEQASVQDIVQKLTEQVGLKYDWNKSHAQTDPLCRNWVRNVDFKDKPCSEALEEILKPVGLQYEVQDGVLVLSRQPKSTPPPAAGTSFNDLPVQVVPVRLAALRPDQMPELKGRPLCVYNFTSW